MRKIIITTESGNDIPKWLKEKYAIHIIPMHITMGEQTYDDGSIPVQKIYDYYEKTSKVPATSAANVYDFISEFEKIREEFPDCVIFHLAYSAVTTCSYQNAVIAAKDMEDIYLIDTKNVSGGATAYIARAAHIIKKYQDELDDSKESYELLVKKLNELSEKVHFSFMPGNLNFLKAGGRLSNGAYLGGKILRIKPLIELVNGKLVATKKHCGSIEHLIPRFIEDFVNKHNISKDALYMVATEGLSEKARKLMLDVAERLGFKHFELNPCGLVITCHSGPSSIGIGGIEL